MNFLYVKIKIKNKETIYNYLKNNKCRPSTDNTLIFLIFLSYIW